MEEEEGVRMYYVADEGRGMREGAQAVGGVDKSTGIGYGRKRKSGLVTES